MPTPSITSPSTLSSTYPTDAVFSLDTELVASAAELLRTLGSAAPAMSLAGQAAHPAAGMASEWEMLQPLAAAVSPSAPAVAEFIRLATAALDDQAARVTGLEDYGHAASVALHELVEDTLSAESALSQTCASLHCQI